MMLKAKARIPRIGVLLSKKMFRKNNEQKTSNKLVATTAPASSGCVDSKGSTAIATQSIVTQLNASEMKAADTQRVLAMNLNSTVQIVPTNNL